MLQRLRPTVSTCLGRRLTRLVLVGVALGLAACSETGEPAPLPPPSRALRVGDSSALVVVVPPTASEALRFAAADLREVARERAGALTAPEVVVAGAATLDPTSVAGPLVVLAGVRPPNAAALPLTGAPAESDPRFAESYVIAEEAHPGRIVLRVEARCDLGLAYGLYDLAARLGARYYHPRESFVPRGAAATLPDAFATPVVASPAMELRGYHQHTQHPIPMSDFLLRPAAEWRPYISEYFRWLLRNRQNLFQWHMLATVDLPAWQAHGQWIVAEGRRHGVKVGLVLAFADKQQNGFRLIADVAPALPEAERIAHQREQLRAALDDLLALDLGLAHLHVTFATSEMTTVSDGEVLAWFDELVNWAATAAPELRLFAHLHIPGALYAEDGATLFYHLPLQAAPAVGLCVHTTMFYDLEHPAPVYGNVDFTHAQRPFVAARGERDLVYFPETAWWLGFDNNLPLLLPITGFARAYDLAQVLPGLLGETPLTGHITFTTGIEWTYWMYDHFLAAATWDPRFTWDDYLADVAALYGSAGPAVTQALRDLTAAQVEAFFAGDPYLFYYLAGESQNDELGAPSGLVGRPVKVPFWDVFHKDAAAFEAWETTELAPLRALRDRFATVAADLGAADPGPGTGDIAAEAVARRFLELRAAADILAWRAAHAVLLYEGVALARAGDEAGAYAKLAAARAITADVQGQVAEVEARVYRYPLELCAAEKPQTLTAYPFGDLYETHTAHFWQRRDDQLQALLDVVFEKVPEGFEPGYDTVYASDGQATDVIEPDVSDSMKNLLAAYVPSMLLGVAGETPEGLPLALGEDLNGNGQPDRGTVVQGLTPPAADPWTFPFALLPLAIGDSANPLGTLNLREGQVTVSLAAGVPTTLQVASRVQFRDLLDALIATGMFDDRTAWEMVAPLFGLDPAAEPRPEDFPLTFVAPLAPRSAAE